jgi:nicotinic acetylcholine receptor
MYSASVEMLPGMDRYKATIYPDGSVAYNFPTIVESTCLVDVTYFPFDIQNCSLQFGSWSYNGLELDIVNSGTSGKYII